RPVGQVAAGVFALEEVRSALEVPVDDAGEIRPLAEAFAQHSVEGRFALQRRQALAAQAELVHPALTGLAVARRPHLAAVGSADLRFEPEVRPAGYAHARRQFEAAGE